MGSLDLRLQVRDLELKLPPLLDRLAVLVEVPGPLLLDGIPEGGLCLGVRGTARGGSIESPDQGAGTVDGSLLDLLTLDEPQRPVQGVIKRLFEYRLGLVVGLPGHQIGWGGSKDPEKSLRAMEPSLEVDEVIVASRERHLDLGATTAVDRLDRLHIVVMGAVGKLENQIQSLGKA